MLAVAESVSTAKDRKPKVVYLDKFAPIAGLKGVITYLRLQQV
jgi:hypothetical protein